MPVLSEQDHRKLICPIMTQHVAAQLNGTPHCCGSDCGMWQWQSTEWTNRNILPQERHGYCGLARNTTP